MSLINLEVMHKSFGLGTIISQNGKYITVKFENTQKIFVYPDIFEKFLTLADGTISEQIEKDLADSKAAKQKEIDKKNEENLRAMTHGIVIPGKEIVANESEDEENRFKNSENEEA